METKTRNYGIDLLRLISMLMVVILHVLGQGGILNYGSRISIKGEFFWALEILCYGAVNIFAIISGYVGIKSRHRYGSLIYLCIQLMFYSTIITAIEVVVSLVNGQALSFGTILLHLFPSVKNCWYFSVYFCLFFFMPILNEIVNKLSRNILRIAGAFVFFVFVCWTQISDVVSALKNGYSVLWLAILYVLGAYMAKYRLFEKWSIKKCIFGYFAFSAMTVLSRFCIYGATKIIFGEAKSVSLLISYTSPTVLLASICLVCACTKLNVGTRSAKVISFLSPMAFGVYLIHCHPYLYNMLKNAFSWVVSIPIVLGVLAVIGFALMIFIACLFADWLRLLFFNLINIKSLSQWIEKILKKFFAKILKIFKITFEE